MAIELTPDCGIHFYMDDNDKAFLEMEEKIKTLEAQVPRWISVEEGLPKRYELVLATTRFTDEGEPNFEIAYYALNGWKKEAGLLYGKVTHWMPLPEPPEKEDAK